MGWVKIPKEHHALFEAALPNDDRISTIKMFGGIAGMVNGHMAMGLWARTVVVRLSEKDRSKVLAMEGGGQFDPMGKGRPMADMALLPEGLLDDKSALRRWLQRAADFTSTLAPKIKKKKAAKKATTKKAKKKKAAKKATTKKAKKKKAAKKAQKKKAAKKKTTRKKKKTKTTKKKKTKTTKKKTTTTTTKTTKTKTKTKAKKKAAKKAAKKAKKKKKR